MEICGVNIFSMNPIRVSLIRRLPAPATRAAAAVLLLLPLTPAVPQVVPVPMPYPVYPQPDYPGVPVYPTDPTYRPMTTRPIWTDRTLPVWIGEVSQTIGVSTSSTGWTGGIHGQA